jgi:uncharacterized repeat protein (TIGR03803 family)
MTKLSAWKKTCTVFVVCAATAIASPAQTVTILHRFYGADGAGPQYMSPVQGVDGNFYGTTAFGGGGSCSSGCGEVFRITPEGRLRTRHFCAEPNCVDGSGPFAGLVLATDGNFYGTTEAGGANEGGTIFKITPGGLPTTLYTFCSQPDCADGREPEGTLVQANDGNLYGTTAQGGSSTLCIYANGCGTVFKVTPEGALTTLYTFCSQPNCVDGDIPLAGLVQATDGRFYGTTAGSFSPGLEDSTVFEITSAGKLTTLYNFCTQANCADGRRPFAGLVQASDGNFYGTTSVGGVPQQCGDGYGCGTVFKITPEGALTTLYRFCSQPNCVDGLNPTAGLVQATDGNLYGTTSGGDFNASGTLFNLTLNGTLTTLYSFCNSSPCPNGNGPVGGLVQGTAGNFYGTTNVGGNFPYKCDRGLGCGTVFSLDMGLGPFAAFVRAAAKVGGTSGILGQGFTGTTSVSLNGAPATFTVVSDTFIKATVPAGATTGYVTVTTPTGTLTSNVPFHVIP